MLRLSKQAWLSLGVGLAVGYLVYKHRAALVEKARLAGERTDALMRGPRERLDASFAGGRDTAQ